MKCCLCGEKFSGYGNNAQPLKNGTCCDDCNMMKVIPARLKEMRKIQIGKVTGQELEGK